MKLNRRFGMAALALAALFNLGVGALSAQRIERVFESGDQDKTQQPVGARDNLAITADQATVLAANPGATVANVQLENEDGVLQYSVKLNTGKEVLVNAANGQIINPNQTQREQEDEDDGD